MSEIYKLGEVLQIGDTLIMDGREYIYEKDIMKYMPTLGRVPNRLLRLKSDRKKTQLLTYRHYIQNLEVKEISGGWEILKGEPEDG